MKKFILSLIFLATLASLCHAQSDSLLINLKNKSVEKIALSQIQKITFENITIVEEQLKPASILNTIGNNPNPFSEQTNIEFDIATPGTVLIMIYDNSGNQINHLECPDCSAGKHSLIWNGYDSNYSKVQSGAYFYEVRFGSEVQSKKMILVK
ncbi:MAG: Por secretion system C-terminal sorting protein [Ignavibacteria bacterium]|nr:Por secretion system C-terminal sorting protein [Ignavibacteria bacterium]